MPDELIGKKAHTPLEPGPDLCDQAKHLAAARPGSQGRPCRARAMVTGAGTAPARRGDRAAPRSGSPPQQPCDWIMTPTIGQAVGRIRESTMSRGCRGVTARVAARRYSGVTYAAVSPPSTRNVAPLTYDDSSAGEEQRRVGDLSRRREPAHRQVDAPPLVRGGVVGEQAHEQRRLHRPGAQRVDANALARELHRELATHREHRALRRCVPDLRRRGAHQRHERRDVDHRAATTLEQMGDAVLAAEEHAFGVDGLDAVLRVGLGGEDRVVVGRHDARVVVEDVDAAVGLDGPCIQRCERWSASLTSTSTKVARLHSAAACAPADVPTSATTTDAPSAEKSTAASRPMPPAAPVITATLPSRRPMCVSPPWR